MLARTTAGARLVTADPEPGWHERTWYGDGWLRVDFARGERVSSMIATWNGPYHVRTWIHP